MAHLLLRTRMLYAITLVIGLGAGSSRAAAQLICGPLNPSATGINQTCNATRALSLFVGTLTPVGVPVLPANLVWSSDGNDGLTRDAVAKLAGDGLDRGMRLLTKAH